MSTFFPSGIDRPEFARIAARKANAGMINRFMLTDGILAMCHQYPTAHWFIDSGAFTKELTQADIASYAEMIIQYADVIELFAAPDKIGDQVQSNKNYAYLLSLLPVDLHPKVLWIYQYGANSSYLVEALTNHQRIGIGGLVPLLNADYDRGSECILALASVIAEAGVVPHYFGIGSLDLVKKLKTIHPAFTIDNSTWIQAAKNGTCINHLGKRVPKSDLMRIFGVNFGIDECLAQNVQTMNAWLEPLPKPKRRKEDKNQMAFDLFLENVDTQNIA